MMRWLWAALAVGLLVTPNADARFPGHHGGGVGAVGPIVHQVANAPAWTASTSYATTGHDGNRVLVSAGYSAGNWTDGVPVYLLELTTAGTSGSVMPAPSSCPRTGITDGGTVVWKCLTKVDYIDLISAANDDPVQWAPHTGANCNGTYSQVGSQRGCYFLYQIVIYNGQAWFQCAGPTPSGVAICPGSGWPSVTQGYQCASGGVPPTVAAGPNLDGSCAWKKLANVPYASNHAVAWPHLVIFGDPQVGCGGLGCADATPTASANHIFNLWSGGVAAPTYPKVLLQQHINNTMSGADNHINCPGNGDIFELGVAGCWSATFQAATGEGVCNWAPGTRFAYNASPAVRIEQSGNDYAIQMFDVGFNFNCLQIKNTGGGRPAIGTLDNSLNDGGYLALRNSIVDSDGVVSIAWDNANLMQNVLCINRNTGANAACVESKYAGAIFNNTIVQLGGSTGGVPVAMDCLSQRISFDSAGAPSIRGNIMMGFSQPFAWNNCTGPTFNYTAAATSNNSTDLPTGAISGSWTSPWSGNGEGVTAIGGTSNIYSQTMAATFVNPTPGGSEDWRLKGGSPAIGAGASYLAGVPGNYGYTTSAFDIFGTSRGPSFDLGPAQ